MMILKPLPKFLPTVVVSLLVSAISLAQMSPTAAEIKPPKLEKDRVDVKLPGSVDGVAIGGAGRYLLLQFGSLRKVGVFDVNEAKISHYISIPDSESKIAAGLSKMVLISGDGSTISRYDIASGERELTSTIELPSSPSDVLMGNASQGPVVVSCGRSNTPTIVDVKTLKSSKMEFSGNSRLDRAPRKISANGKTLTCWGSGSPSGLNTITRTGNDWVSRYEHESVGAIFPSADGKTLFTSNGIYTSFLKRVDGNPTSHRVSKISIPAVHGGFYLNINISRSGGGGRFRSNSKKTPPPAPVSLHMLGESRSLGSVKLENVLVDADHWGRGEVSLDQRYIFLPQANLIVQLSSTREELILTQFDVKKAMAESDVEYLFVESYPPTEISAGNQFQYQIKAQSKSGGIKYSIDSGPKGMNISDSGLVSWSTSTNSPPKSSVIATVADKSGQEIFHTFDLKVLGGKGAEDVATGNAAYSEQASASVTASEFASGENEKIVKLPETIGDLVVGGGGRSLLIHFKNLKKIGLFDVAKGKIVKYFPAADDQTLIAAGANHLVVVSQDQGVIARYNLTTFERELTKNLPFVGTVKNAVMGNNSYGPLMVRWSASNGAIDQARFAFIDLKSLDETEMTWPKNNHMHSVNRDRIQITVSNDGKVFAAGGFAPLRLSGNKIDFLTTRQGLMNINQPLITAADGKHFIGGNQIFNSNLISTDNKNQDYKTIILPAVSGQYYLKMSIQDSFGRRSREKGNGKGTAKLYLFGDSRPVISISDLTLPAINRNGLGMKQNKKLMFIPDAKVIVSVSPTLDSLVLKRFDIKEALAESGIDYLIVTSNAPETAKMGQPYEYQLETLSKKGGVTYKLESAPEGMTISTEGKVQWTPTNTIEQEEVKVIATVSDSTKQEVFHNFSIQVPEVRELVEAKNVAAEKERARLVAEKRLADRTKHLEEIEAIAARNRKKALEQVRKIAAESASNTKTAIQPSKPKQYPIEKWTDTTGKHTLDGRFQEIKNESKVVLEVQGGFTKSVLLSKLQSKHIYRAVAYDLQRRNPNSGASSSESPFQEADTNRPITKKNLITPEVLEEVIASFERMIELTKTEKDSEKLMRGILSPAMFERFAEQRNRRHTSFQLSKDELLQLKGSLLSIDFSKAKSMSEQHVITVKNDRRRTPVEFRKIEGVWYLDSN